MMLFIAKFNNELDCGRKTPGKYPKEHIQEFVA
jgi:hypothetical protein